VAPRHPDTAGLPALSPSKPAADNRLAAALPGVLPAGYVADATRHDPGAKEPDGYELWSEFKPIVEVERLPLSNGQRYFLTVALATARARA